MSKSNKILPYSRQLIEDDDIQAVIAVLRSDFVTQGPKIKEFEQALADYTGARFAVAFATGTAALHAAYFAADLQPADELITSPITFAATANAGLYLGARPVFVDVEPESGNMDTSLIEAAVSERTKMIVPVHFAGHPVELDAIHELARSRSLLVIEDASHALGARYKDKKIGTLSDLTVFSFHPVKPITTGEGGAVLTNHEKYYQRLLMFREHGITKNPELLLSKGEGDWYYEMQYLGFNYRITDIQCALGISQLRKLEGFIERRREIVARYLEGFKDNPWFEIPHEKEYAHSSWHLFPLRLRDHLAVQRKEIFHQLREKGLWVQVHYIPVYWQPYYEKLGYEEGICPKAEDFYRRELSLPLFQAMNDEDMQQVIETVQNTFSQFYKK